MAAGLKHKVGRGAAYFGVPLLFCLILSTIVYAVGNPIVRPILSAAEMLMTERPTNGEIPVKSIFQGDTGVLQGKTVNIAQVEIPSIGTHYAHLSIERIGVDTDLYYGDSDEVLKLGVAGQYPGSMLPGFGKPVLISGHNHQAFNPLQFIEVGDLVKIQTNYGLYTYEVKETKVIRSYDFNRRSLGEKRAQVILYTCYPFRTYGLGSQRFFVFADQISGPEIVKGEALTE